MKTKTIFVSMITSILFSYSVLSAAAISSQPVVQEKVGFRNGNTRVWEITRELPVVNDETGITGMVTVSNQVYEKADNLCYNKSTTKIANWVPTVEEITPATERGFAYQAKQGAYQVSFVGDLTTPWSIIYQVKNQTIKLGVKYLGYYDSSNGSSVFLATANSIVPQLVAPNKLIYRNAFPGVDIEYVYTKSRFLQNAIINSTSSYSSPEKYGMNPKTTQLIIATEIDIADNPAIKIAINKKRYKSETLDAETIYPITISNSTTGKRLCSFEPNHAFDNSIQDTPNEIPVYQQLRTINNKHYLIEGIPLTWLTAATLPVTVDWELRSGGISGNEVWKSGVTYIVSSDVTVNEGYTLVIQGGAIVKMGSANQHEQATSIKAAAGAQILACGNPYNYVVFTSINDTAVGANPYTITESPQMLDHGPAIDLEPYSSESSRVEYCKIAWGSHGVRVRTNLATDAIQNNIFRNNARAVWVEYSNVTQVGIKNNLIENARDGIVLWHTSSGVIIENNTISTTEGSYVSSGNTYVVGRSGIEAGLNSTVAHAENNLIRNCTYGLWSSFGGAFQDNDFNAFYRNVYNYYGDITPGIHDRYIYDLPNEEHNPNKISPNGMYYLNNDWDNPCISNPDAKSPTEAGLQYKTTREPMVVNQNITSGDHTWIKIDRDNNNTVDIGYHYEPVDVVVGTSSNDYAVAISGNVNLSIDSGVIISFYRDIDSKEALLQFQNGAKIFAVGSNSIASNTALIQFTSIYATSDQIQSPFRGGQDYYNYVGIELSESSSPDSNFQFCEFKYGAYGLLTFNELNIDRPIQNNIFKNNCCGIWLNNSGNVVNNLFTDNLLGLYFNPERHMKKAISYVQSNTFYNNDTAVYVVSYNPFNQQTAIIRIENNIITSNYGGCIGYIGTNGSIQSETRNNIFWNNELNVDGTYISVNNSNTENKDLVNEYCPMLAHKALFSDNQFITQYPHDGFYLAQRTGDASRFPFRQHDLVRVDLSGLSQYSPGGSLYFQVYASDNLGSQTLLGEYYTGGEHEEPYYTDGSDCWGNILLEFYDYWRFDDGDYLDLIFAHGSTMRVYFPDLGIVEGKLFLWVAQDGSSYWGRSDRSALYAQAPDQDAEFAMQYDMPSITGLNDTGLAKSAYDGRYARYQSQDLARSPAVDKGAVKVTPASALGTEEDVAYSVFASLGLTNTDENYTDCTATYRYIGQTITENIPDPIGGRLDLGYHYKNGVVYVTEALDTVQDIINESVYKYTIDPYHIDIGYGGYNSQTLETDPILIYSGYRVEGDYDHPETIAYHIKNTPINKVLVSLPWYDTDGAPSPFPGIADVVACTTPQGTTYCAVGYNIFHLDPGEYWSVITIFRYIPASDTWTPIAGLGLYGYPNNPLPAGVSNIGLAADTNTVWLAWSDCLASNIFVSIISTKITYTDLEISDFAQFSNYYSVEPATRIDITYDEFASLELGAKATFRLVYINIDEKLHEFKLKPDQDEKPSIVRENNISSIAVSNDIDAHIVYNPNDITNSAKRAYVAYVGDNGGTIHTADLDASNPNSESWTEEYGNYSSAEFDVTYRGNGNKLFVYRNGVAGIYSNSGIIKEDGENPKVATETVTKRDIIANWYWNYRNNDDPALFLRELYP